MAANRNGTSSSAVSHQPVDVFSSRAKALQSAPLTIYFSLELVSYLDERP